ncbi:hypothetical protein KY289_020987 [Solanum tuberosum]|nr:hypothetical protein KY289_020987 [Solanum tuberosum]
MDKKRAKGLCYSSDEKYVVGHMIDTESIHKLIDQEVEKRLSCKANPILEQSISVVDEREVHTASICKNIQ